MNQSLQTVVNFIESNPDNVVIRWQGMIYDEEDHFVRLDKLFLYLLYMNEGVPILRRVVGYVGKNYDNEPQVRFPSDVLYRVLNGARMGRILPKDKLLPGEKYGVSGLYKQLEEGTKPYQFNFSRKGDQFLLEFITDLAENVDKLHPIINQNFLYPAFYLSCKPLNRCLYLRKGSELGKDIRSFCKNYVENQSPLFNFINNRNRFCLDAGMGRIAYPYNNVFGKGVVVASTDSIGKWLLASKTNVEINNSEVYLSVKLSDKNEGLLKNEVSGMDGLEETQAG
jgi:hypothetical protein